MSLQNRFNFYFLDPILSYHSPQLPTRQPLKHQEFDPFGIFSGENSDIIAKTASASNLKQTNDIFGDAAFTVYDNMAELLGNANNLTRNASSPNFNPNNSKNVEEDLLWDSIYLAKASNNSNAPTEAFKELDPFSDFLDFSFSNTKTSLNAKGILFE